MDILSRVMSLVKRHDLSLLRYPGGKRKIIPLLTEIILKNNTDIKLFVEPFAGGASASIAMLQSGVVEEIALADKDDLVASLWRVVFSKEASILADMIANAMVNISIWRSLKNGYHSDNIGKAYKCLFLNRTSFSGILHKSAGPIGGIGQNNKYKIDCRFNRTILAKRILELSEFRDRVRFVRAQNYIKTIADIKRTRMAQKSDSHIFWYLDPPFFEKANKLYNYSFSFEDHRRLKEEIFRSSFPGKWIMSYDDTLKARQMYGKYEGFCRVNLSYNARIDTKERLTSSEIIVSNVIAERRLSGDLDIPPVGEIIPIAGFLTNKEPGKLRSSFDRKRILG